MNNKSTEIKSILSLNINSLSELQGWKEKQEQLVVENPFIEIKDNKTFSEAKKRRTNLLKGRTLIEGQDKLIASQLKHFRGLVSVASKELISISLPFEVAQQTEVKRYEAFKSNEKLEKQRLEVERIEAIQNKIKAVYLDTKSAINALKYPGINDFDLLDLLSEIDLKQFQEFQLKFNENLSELKCLFIEKKQQLESAEEQRIESERLTEERKILEKQKQELAEKQAAIDLDNKRKADEIAREKQELAEKQKQIDVENKAKKDAIDKQKAELKKEQDLANEKEKIRLQEKQAKELAEKLRPEKEKIIDFLYSLTFTKDVPVITDETLKSELDKVMRDFALTQREVINRFTNK
ncbi:hypothetical protein J2Q11_12325 [Tenacibaculum finnmarkense genomovar finnmarkense]|uniref:hypothetical protein n=1 Tax=Tenacibaculum finnmarkense TaxID=2781243 RepID=UPI001EFAC2BB|nr:hypothetical protein [Tenacibaculum finnmarkense]MCG8213589.1 hypothetical protein [Tenacibaculum finnmarkense genomovar finnmarkense]MCG8231916.1 hypothetical protein [Tenacibaculum finnmarkense genomovar finnmarkense]MCG8886470.1 hypothetical protein [Tenacibaculum finnmarkense]MCG8897252.1 hypothetical protein [Tenacibaculum finnmarkense]MCG8903970.1 hypothetical protein [Tenacibaculum finnmarkense]